MKPGYRTTEFWVTLTGQVIALLVLFKCVSPAEGQTLGTALTNAVAAVATILASAKVVIGYVESRTDLKRTATRG